MNIPTVENLKELYNSLLYQNLLKEFELRFAHKLEREEDVAPNLHKYLISIQRRYLVLNISFEEVLDAFERLKEKLLNFTIRSIDFFVAQEISETDKFAQVEELDNDDFLEKEEGFVSRVFFLDKFCEAYLLNLNDKERLLHYLTTTQMPYAEEYLEQITKLFNR